MPEASAIVGADRAWLREFPAYKAVCRNWPDAALLACSGGVDSTALLLLAAEAHRAGDISQFRVLHVDHGSRAESAAEGLLVVKLAESLGFSAQSVRADSIVAIGEGPEDSWRAQRYQAFARVAGEVGRDDIVTAHNRDDQVETVLMRLLTGSGGSSAAGMRAVVEREVDGQLLRIHRPLLDTSRAELRAILERAGVAPILDPTNVDRRRLRNAIRLDVVPTIAQVLPHFHKGLLRSVELAARDAETLDQMAREWLGHNTHGEPNRIHLPLRELRTLPPAVSSRAILFSARTLMPDNARELTTERVNAVLDVLNGEPGKRIELPYYVTVTVRREHLELVNHRETSE